jgi:hypothetical protein
MTEKIKILESKVIKDAIWTAIKSKTNVSNQNHEQTAGPWIEDVLFEQNLDHMEGVNYGQDALGKVLADSELISKYVYEQEEPPIPSVKQIQVEHYLKPDDLGEEITETTINVNITDRTAVDFNSMLDNFRLFNKGVNNHQSAYLDGYDVIYDATKNTQSEDYITSTYYPNLSFKFINGHPHAFYLLGSLLVPAFTFPPDWRKGTGGETDVQPGNLLCRLAVSPYPHDVQQYCQGPR